MQIANLKWKVYFTHNHSRLPKQRKSVWQLSPDHSFNFPAGSCDFRRVLYPVRSIQVCETPTIKDSAGSTEKPLPFWRPKWPSQSSEWDSVMIRRWVGVGWGGIEAMVYNPSLSLISRGFIKNTSDLTLPTPSVTVRGLLSEGKLKHGNRPAFGKELHRYPFGYPLFGVKPNLCRD